MKDVALNIAERDLSLSPTKLSTSRNKVLWGALFDDDSPYLMYMNIVISNKQAQEIAEMPEQGYVIPIYASYQPSPLTFIVRLIKDNKGALQKVGEPFGAAITMNNDEIGAAIMACQLPAINVYGNFYVHLTTNGEAYIFDGDDWDLQVIESKYQENDLMMQCDKGKHYRYPTVGVGFAGYINSIPMNAGLADKMLAQFATDGKSIEAADFEVLNGNILVDVTTSYTGNDNVPLTDMNLLDVSALNIEVIRRKMYEAYMLKINGSTARETYLTSDNHSEYNVIK